THLPGRVLPEKTTSHFVRGELHSLRSLSSGKNKPDLGSNLLKINMYKHACAHARGKTGGGARFGVRDDDKHTRQTKNGSRP
ncbi:hypothetical protein ACUB1P_004402, partial [Raoultella ornithinolytica]